MSAHNNTPGDGPHPSGRQVDPLVSKTPAGAAGESPDLIPWDSTGKIDDEVERRSRPLAPGSPKGGGESATAEGAGPGRYGGAGAEQPGEGGAASEELMRRTPSREGFSEVH
ncbi:MAG TPA: hypothetical protein VKY74_02595 [Chloroflexia bacterium]|nr:hypothetical protein [Chloroflexia bacterium]